MKINWLNSNIFKIFQVYKMSEWSPAIESIGTIAIAIAIAIAIGTEAIPSH